jgi:hypothetical protein
VLGRFISADTIIASLANPQSLNRYSYVYNNPINNTDPTGHRPCDGEFGCSAEPQQKSTPPKGPTNTNTPDGGNTPANQATSADDTDGGDNGNSSPESPTFPGGYNLCPSCHAPGLHPDLEEYLRPDSTSSSFSRQIIVVLLNLNNRQYIVVLGGGAFARIGV